MTVTDDPPTPWLYRARLEDVVDGDTVDVTVDLGFRLTRTIRLRLTGVDTSEVFGVPLESCEYARGNVHEEFTREWFATAEARHADQHADGDDVGDDDDGDDEWPLLVNTHADSREKFGRYTATVIRRSPEGEWALDATLTDALVDEFGEVVRSS